MIIAYFLLIVMLILSIITIPQIILAERDLWEIAKRNGWKTP